MTLTAPHAGAAGTAAGPRPWAGMTAPRGGRRVGRRRRWFTAHPAWPVTALLAGYPVWWALGLGDLSVIIMAVPMVLRMHAWHRQGRRVRVPPAFGLWLMFLVVVAAGIATLGLTAPGTVVSPLSNRLLAFVIRGLTYLALTVILLYAGNLTESELPRRRLAWLLGLVGIYATIGGLAGVVAPGFQFKSPMAYVLPQSMQQNNLVQAALYPGFSQVTDVLGITEGRPKAPFEYTNTWGNCLSILLPWLLVAWWSYGTRRQRKLAVVTVPPGCSTSRATPSAGRCRWPPWMMLTPRRSSGTGIPGTSRAARARSRSARRRTARPAASCRSAATASCTCSWSATAGWGRSCSSAFSPIWPGVTGAT